MPAHSTLTPKQRLAEAQALVDAGDLEAAEELLAALIAEETVPVDARVLYARVLMRQERGGDALAAARDALARHPFDVRTTQLPGAIPAAPRRTPPKKRWPISTRRSRRFPTSRRCVTCTPRRG